MGVGGKDPGEPEGMGPQGQQPGCPQPSPCLSLQRVPGPAVGAVARCLLTILWFCHRRPVSTLRMALPGNYDWWLMIVQDWSALVFLLRPWGVPS